MSKLVLQTVEEKGRKKREGQSERSTTSCFPAHQGYSRVESSASPRELPPCSPRAAPLLTKGMAESSQVHLPCSPRRDITEQQMELTKPKVSFKITKSDYIKIYKSVNKGGSQKGGNCVASDFRNTLLSGLVSDLDTIEGLPVEYIQKKTSPSKSRNKVKEVRFIPDVIKPYLVCNVKWILGSNEQHNTWYP